jgi:hypothetical protein
MVLLLAVVVETQVAEVVTTHLMLSPFAGV